MSISSGVRQLLIDHADPVFKADAALDLTKNFVAGAENALEQVELLLQELVNALVGLVLLIEEVENNNIVLLAVAMTAANALFDPLRIPGQIVVDHQGTELKVDAFGGDSVAIMIWPRSRKSSTRAERISAVRDPVMRSRALVSSSQLP